jgi:hypothetical protein
LLTGSRVLSRLVSGFIHHSKGMRERLVDGVGSSKANKQILSDYSRMEIQDGRVLPNGLLRGIVYIPLMRDREVISLRWTAVENGDL